jgi:hypothetical protein
MTPSISARPPRVRTFRRIHVANVCPSHAAALRVSHGATADTLRAIRSSRSCACAKSASASGGSFGTRPR